jgi:hypothetical protein
VGGGRRGGGEKGKGGRGRGWRWRGGGVEGRRGGKRGAGGSFEDICLSSGARCLKVYYVSVCNIINILVCIMFVLVCAICAFGYTWRNVLDAAAVDIDYPVASDHL